MENNEQELKLKELCALIGELTLFASTLDYLLNRALISVLGLEDNPILLPVIATLDPSRKFEILKQWATHIKNPEWRKGLVSFVEKSEQVFKYRNIACHSVPVFIKDEWYLTGASVAKKLKGLNNEGRMSRTSGMELKKALETGQVAFTKGEAVIANFSKVNEERSKRNNRLK